MWAYFSWAYVWVGTVLGVLGLTTFLLPLLVQQCFRPQDLKKKYKATHALVTGGSSGIGRAISEKLCKQGLNVIIVAQRDKLLDDATAELRRDYPDLEITPVGEDLSKPGYMTEIDKATEGKDVQLIFCNAGFMKTGFFADTPMGLWRANNAVNVGCHLDITHKFVNRLKKAGKPGCVIFTSSPASMLPSPITVMYGATKAFVTNFASGLAAEVRAHGIDVCAVHPSPVQSRFYDGAHKIDEIAFFKGTAKGPEVLVDRMFATVGRLVMVNQGYYPACVSVLLMMCNWTCIVEIIARIAHTLGGYKHLQAKPAPAKPASAKKSSRKAD